MALITAALLVVAVVPLLVHPLAIRAATAPTNALPHSLPAARCEPCVVKPMEGKHSLRLSLIATKRWCGAAGDRGPAGDRRSSPPVLTATPRAPPPRSLVGGARPGGPGVCQKHLAWF